MKTMETWVVRRVTIPVGRMSPEIGRRTVLVATPDPDLRQAAARVLEASGYRVVTAAHSGHAVLAAMTGGAIDVLVADLAMEDMSGPKLAERLRRHHPHMHAVYIAHAGTPECEGVLVRPFTAHDLIAQIARAGELLTAS